MKYKYSKMKERLTQVLNCMTERERIVLTYYYGLDDGFRRTKQYIAKQFCVPVSGIEFIHTTALRKLRTPLPIAEDEMQGDGNDEESSSSSLGASKSLRIIDLVAAESSLNTALIDHLKTKHDDLLKLKSDVFEHLIAEFYKSWGFDDVRLVGRDARTGADVFAMQKEPHTGAEVRYYVETKRWKNKVDITVINQVLGAMHGEQRIHGWNLGMIVTLAGYTNSKRYDNLDHMGILLKTEDNVIDWLKRYQPNYNGLWLPDPTRTIL